MRAMILAAGRGTRLRPLTDLRPKPVLPVRGIPLLAYSLALLARHGVRDVLINVHHLPEMLKAAARTWCPPGIRLHYSHEPELLGTGGGIRKAAAFLRESDPCLILGGDMLVDADLTRLVELHRARRDALTLLLLDDPRAASFGTIGVADDGRVRRIARRFDLGGEVRAGLYPWVNVVAARAFDSLPDCSAFSHLDHWIAPQLAGGAHDIRGHVASPEDCRWQPVGTPGEYLAANLRKQSLSYLDADARARQEGVGLEPGLVVGAGARIGRGARLSRVVVWDGESVPGGIERSDGVFAGGRFHACSG